MNDECEEKGRELWWITEISFLKRFYRKKELWQSFIINGPFFTWLHHKQTYLFTNKSQTLFWNNLFHKPYLKNLNPNLYQYGILMKYISWKYSQILQFDISRLINRFTKTFRLHTSANENGILNRNAVHCSWSKRELFLPYLKHTAPKYDDDVLRSINDILV